MVVVAAAEAEAEAEAEGFTAGAFMAAMAGIIAVMPIETFVVIGATGVGGTGPVGAIITRLNATQSEPKTPGPSHSLPAGAPAWSRPDTGGSFWSCECPAQSNDLEAEDT